MHQMEVEAFMLRAKQDVPLIPTTPSDYVRILRAKIILEEALETIQKGLGVTVSLDIDQGNHSQSFEINNNQLTFATSLTQQFDMIELIDGCCDVAVVSTGTLSACGIPDTPFQNEVNKNNLMKFGPGYVIRDDGKILKPPQHIPPDIAGILNQLVEA